MIFEIINNSFSTYYSARCDLCSKWDIQDLSKDIVIYSAANHICSSSSELPAFPSFGRQPRADLDSLLRREKSFRYREGGFNTAWIEPEAYYSCKERDDMGKMNTKNVSPCTCSLCSEIPVREEPNYVITPVRSKEETYDDLYWKYVYASPGDEYKIFSELMSKVTLTMTPGDGSWVNTPDPNSPVEVTENSKLKEKPGLGFFEAYFGLRFLPSFWVNLSVGAFIVTILMLFHIIG